MKKYNDGANLSTIKSSNRSLILKILNTHEQISRAELSRRTGLTKTSITNIISELINDGIIYETGTIQSVNGRKPVMLSLADDALYCIGIYISRDYVHTSIANIKGELVAENTSSFDVAQDEHTFLNLIYITLDLMIEKSDIPSDKFLGIGVASIGPVDSKKGVILDPPNFRGLRSIHITEALEEKYKIPVLLDNDMNASAIAEKLFGKGRNISNFVYVGVTNGIGSGIILNGKLFSGCYGFAGEIGHTTIDVNGEKCACGNVGCLELYASIPNAVNQVKAFVNLGSLTNLHDKDELSKADKTNILNCEDINWQKIVAAAASGDNACIKAIQNLVYYLSVGIVNTVNNYDPEVIFIGHDIALAGDMVIKPLEELVNNSSLSRNIRQISVQLSAFNERSPSIGASAIIWNSFFEGEIVGV